MTDIIAADARDPEAVFSPEEMATAETYPALGPAYGRASAIAERVMVGFEAEHFKPLIDKLARDVAERLWNDLEATLLSDVESNVQGSIWRAVDATVNALLTGEKWALERYALAAGRYGEAGKVRAAIAEHCRDHLVSERIADLEAEVKFLRKHNEALQRYR